MSRIRSVDVLRTVAIISVIAIHTKPFEIPSSPVGQALDLATVMNQLARFAVPFFFVLSGYFWAGKLGNGNGICAPTAAMAGRIATIFLFWSAIYLLPWDIVGALSHGVAGPAKETYWNLAKAANRPLTTLVEGTREHLWFLPALLCSLLVSATFLHFRLERLLVAVAVVSYFVGLAGKAYQDTPIGFHAGFNFRNGPFSSLLLFVTGHLLQKRPASTSWFYPGLAVAVFGMLLHFGELAVLHGRWGITMGQDYVLGTYFFGTGAALVGLSNTRWLQWEKVASVGTLVLGIYASHAVFIDLLKPLDRRYSGNAVWEVAYVVAVFLLSFALAWSLSRHRLTRRLVS